MKKLIRGQRIKLSEITSALQVEVGVSVATMTGAAFDVCCFGLDAGGKLADDRYLIFFNQKTSPCHSIAAKGAINASLEVFDVNLTTLPPAVQKLVFTLTLDTAGYMSQISHGFWRIFVGGTEVMQYEFLGTDFQTEKTILVGELYLKDVWRAAALGQGYGDDLPRLVKRFGGEVAQEAAPPPPPVRPTPPPPVLPPPASSQQQTTPPPPPVLPTPPPVPEIVVARENLQKLIDAAAPNSTLTLLPFEYEGPFVINKPLKIEGNGSTLWSRREATVSILHEGVSLADLDIQITGEDESGLALKVSAAAAEFKNVVVRGRVSGLGDADGVWQLPEMVDLGTIPAHQDFSFKTRLIVPVACRLSTQIGGLTIEPSQVERGETEVTLTFQEPLPNVVIFGQVLVESPYFARSISVAGRT